MASPSTSKSYAESADGKSVLPRIISFGFSDYKETVDRRTAMCKVCKAKVGDVCGTSNFNRHLKTHPEQ